MTETAEQKISRLEDDARTAITMVSGALGSPYTMTGTSRQAAQCALLELARLREDNGRLTVERDQAVALAAHARHHLLSGADENTLAGRFWANETRHAFASLPEQALARILADEVDRLGVDIAYDDLFYATDGDTSTGMRRAVKIVTGRSETLRAQEASVSRDAVVRTN